MLCQWLERRQRVRPGDAGRVGDTQPTAHFLQAFEAAEQAGVLGPAWGWRAACGVAGRNTSQ